MNTVIRKKGQQISFTVRVRSPVCNVDPEIDPKMGVLPCGIWTRSSCLFNPSMQLSEPTVRYLDDSRDEKAFPQAI